METRKIRILSLHGLHLREAARVVRTALKFNSEIQLWHNSVKADTRSILDVLALVVPQDSEVILVIEGSDEKEAMREFTQTFQDGEGI